MGRIAKKSRVDYSAVIMHLKNEQVRQANQLLKELMPKLVNYLQITMRADENIARECVQQAFLNVYERIVEDKINDPKSLMSYMMQACRNEFLTQRRYNKRFIDQEAGEPDCVEAAPQIDNLVEKERKKLLRDSLQKLDRSSREFILYYLENPGVSSKQVGRRFGISPENARIRKLRIIRRLHDMVQAYTR
jgi:RNA polymerase sigma factor (sigma-70 family)